MNFSTTFQFIEMHLYIQALSSHLWQPIHITWACNQKQIQLRTIRNIKTFILYLLAICMMKSHLKTHSYGAAPSIPFHPSDRQAPAPLGTAETHILLTFIPKNINNTNKELNHFPFCMRTVNVHSVCCHQGRSDSSLCKCFHWNSLSLQENRWHFLKLHWKILRKLMYSNKIFQN